MKKYLSWENYYSAVLKMVDDIVKGGVKYRYVCGIPRGGLIPAVITSHKLNIPLVSEEKIMSMDLSEILIVDDIIDKGNTLKKYFDAYADIATVFVRKSCKYRPKYKGEYELTQSWLVFPYEDDNVEDTVSIVKS